MSIELQAQQSTILKYLEVTHYIDPDAPLAEEKRAAKYKIGQACQVAREACNSDEDFNEWLWENIIDECSVTDIEEVTVNTLVAWRQLAEFGTLAQCELVGFTHISKLLQPKNVWLKAQILDIIAHHDAETAKPLINAALKPAVDYSLVVADGVQLATTVENVNKLSKGALVALVQAMHQQMKKG